MYKYRYIIELVASTMLYEEALRIEQQNIFRYYEKIKRRDK
jgi:hypothetical protein